MNYVFDGQHTIEIVAAESGSRDTSVWCMIYNELKYTEEAHIFADQQKNVKGLTPYETFAAHIEAGDAKQKMIQTRKNALTLLKYNKSVFSSETRRRAALCQTFEKA